MSNRGKRKIGIVTWFNYANPGTAFQAYALQQYINSLPCCEAEFVNIGNHVANMVNAPILKLYANGYGCLSLPMRFCLTLKAYNFCSFQRKFFVKYPKMSLWLHLSKKDCRMINKRYDWVVLGSDQLWNFGLSSASEYMIDLFFLGFVSGPKKGAYAPSIGVKDWPDELKDRIKDYCLEDTATARICIKHEKKIKE